MGPEKWEYRITRYRLQDFEREDAFERGIYCDNRGQCFLHDTSQAAVDMIRDTLNEEGKAGWELVQFGYHLGEMVCVWKRAVHE